MFDVAADRLDPSFLDWLSKTSGFVDLCRAASEGTTNRVRLKEDKFLATAIPLPPVAERRRVVARVAAVAERVAEARRLRAEAEAELPQLIPSWWDATLRPESGTNVGDFVSIQNGYAFKSEWFSEDGVRLARNANVGHGRLDWDDTARIPESMTPAFERFRLREGDILISLDRPIISTGVKVARVRSADMPSLLLQRVGRVTYQDKTVDPDYFFAWLQSPRFVGAIDPGRSNGVPHIASRDIERLPFTPPPHSEQRRIVAHLDALQAKVDALRAAQAAAAADLDALLPAVLAEAFAGRL